MFYKYKQSLKDPDSDSNDDDWDDEDWFNEHPIF